MNVAVRQLIVKHEVSLCEPRVICMKTRYSLALILSACLPCAALAHHSFAMFDFTRTTELSGTVRGFQWSNPHAWIDVTVADNGGTQSVWGVEMGSPSALYRQGWRQNSLTPGDKVTLVIHPLRDGRTGGSLVSATLPSGVTLMQGGAPGSPGSSSPPPASPPEESKP
jgi:hypothetical protein